MKRPIDTVLVFIIKIIAVFLWIFGFGKYGEKLINYALKHSKKL